MPLVEITLYRGRTPEQKVAIAEAVSRALIDEGGAAPDSVHVIFRACERHDWLKSRELLDDSQ
jgi:phenylpyruvate tautomerase PptA (4-oxalocrotonate tautomerase family)